MIKHTVNSDFTLEQFKEHAEKLYRDHKYVTFHWEVGQQRSPKQNNAMWLWCAQVAAALNDAGLDMIAVLKPGTAIPWTKQSVKDHMWTPVQEAMTGHSSSREPKRDEYPAIYETISRHLGQNHGIYVPWPEREKPDGN